MREEVQVHIWFLDGRDRRRTPSLVPGTYRVFHSEAAKGRVGASEPEMEDYPLGLHNVERSMADSRWVPFVW